MELNENELKMLAFMQKLASNAIRLTKETADYMDENLDNHLYSVCKKIEDALGVDFYDPFY